MQPRVAVRHAWHPDMGPHLWAVGSPQVALSLVGRLAGITGGKCFGFAGEVWGDGEVLR